MPKMQKVSEVQAYVHILNDLVSKKGWAKKQILTQQECLSIQGIAEALGTAHPENVVKLGETMFYVIEAKNKREKLNLAIKEARDLDSICKVTPLSA